MYWSKYSAEIHSIYLEAEQIKPVILLLIDELNKRHIAYNIVQRIPKDGELQESVITKDEL